MGYEYGDTQNSAVRVFLNQFSKRFETFFDKDDWKQKTIEYFDGRCPYSGVALEDVRAVKDHVIPMNRQECGLHLYGNILVVSHSANTWKHNKPLEKFLGHEPQRLKRIKEFISESGFENIYAEYSDDLKRTCGDLYGQVRALVESKVLAFHVGKSKERPTFEAPPEKPTRRIVAPLDKEPMKPKLASSGNHGMTAEELNTVRDRVLMWSKKPSQKSHLYLAILVRLEREGLDITKENWTRVVSKVGKSRNAKGTVASLATSKGNAYGRVTQFRGGFVELHPAVRDLAIGLNWHLSATDWHAVKRMI